MLKVEKTKQWLSLFCLLIGYFLNINLVAAEEQDPSIPDKKVPQNKITNKKAIVIETRVTGSQEQPKVLYIMPWQGIKKPIKINGNKRVLVMPTFQPINPKEFKKQVSSYYQKSNSASDNTKEN